MVDVVLWDRVVLWAKNGDDWDPPGSLITAVIDFKCLPDDFREFNNISVSLAHYQHPVQGNLLSNSESA